MTATETNALAAAPITAYKGFDKNLSCRGHQFEVGKTYTLSGVIRACHHGFHSCENPWDVLSYYTLVNSDGEFNRFGETNIGGEISRHSDDSKLASAEITVKLEFTASQWIQKLVGWIVNATNPSVLHVVEDDVEAAGNDARIGSSGNGARIGSSGDDAQIGSSGYDARIGSSGNAAQIGSSGDGARIGSSGNAARIGSSGYAAQIGSSGDDAQIGSSGNGAQIGSSGYDAQIGSSGDGAQIGSSGSAARIGSSGYAAQIGSSGYGALIGSSGYGARIGSSGSAAQIGSSGNGARIGSSGYDARIKADGENAVVASAGRNTRVKGAVGAWVSLAEFDDEGACVGFATGKIGDGDLKPGVWYRAAGGRLVETEK